MARAAVELCMYRNWASLAFQTALLAAESQQVIMLRMMKMAAGGAAATREAELMFSEKMIAFGEMGGQSPAAIVRKYRGKVKANRRRLVRAKV